MMKFISWLLFYILLNSNTVKILVLFKSQHLNFTFYFSTIRTLLLIVWPVKTFVVEVPVLMRGRLSGNSSITRRKSAYYMLKVTLAMLVDAMRGKPLVEEA